MTDRSVLQDGLFEQAVSEFVAAVAAKLQTKLRGRLALSLADMHKVAATRGGRCLSDDYLGKKVPLLWQCEKGHQWMARPSNIRSGSWCPHCVRRPAITEEDIRRIAAERGGEFLGFDHDGPNKRAILRCEAGHEWMTTPSPLRDGRHWCAACRRLAKLTIADMMAAAEAKGGRCLSEQYLNNSAPLLWECKNGHQWTATAQAVRNAGTWCQKCWYERWSIEDVQRLAVERGGEFASPEFRRASDIYLWRCESGHEWKARLHDIKRGSWCPECARVISSRGEKISRAVLQSIFETKFPKIRPEWLRWKRRLELDGYSEERQIAFEFQGQHHYNAGGHIADEAHDAILARDAFKAKKCAEQGVRLIVIPYFDDTTDVAACVSAVVKEVWKAGLTIPSDWVPPTDFRWLHSPLENVVGEHRLSQLMNMIANRGGSLLSTSATKATDKLRYRCAEGHEWDAEIYRILRGNWCATCAWRGRKQKLISA